MHTQLWSDPQPGVESFRDRCPRDYSWQLRWLLYVRWVALAGQVATIILTDRFLDISFNMGGLVLCLGFTTATNAWIQWRGGILKKHPAMTVAALLMTDSLILTIMLFLSGGAHNPFTSFYLLHVTLAAVLLPGVWALLISCLSIGGFVWLYLSSEPVCHTGVLNSGISQDLHFQGMVISFALTAIFITYFVGRIQLDLRRSNLALENAHKELGKRERFASLTTLAAGVAHELATPLGTIALVSKELENTIGNANDHDVVMEDARIIRREIERCRLIIERLSVGTDPLESAQAESFSVQDAITALLEYLPESHRRRLKVNFDDAKDETLVMALNPLMRSLSTLIKNAVEADPDEKEVELNVRHSSEEMIFEVKDDGSGMDEQVLSKIGEPFFTTKEPGKGMGLGLFLVRMLAEQANGRFEAVSKTGEGSTVRLVLPKR
jgi:two-component system, sensor histidine kinase RegB